MVTCEYCSSTFDDEESYLRHLGDAHRDELGAIDRRRVESAERGDGTSVTRVYAAVAVGVLLLAIGTYALFAGGGGGSAPDGIEAESLPDQGDQSLLENVQTFPKPQRTDHVDPGTDLQYEQLPPVGGPHYAGTVNAGFYEQSQAMGDVVHTLEHGAVVVYYDPATVTPEARESLTEFANQHTGRWKSVVVVPNPNDDPDAPYVLTAWRTKLTMQEYDARTVRAFLAEYLGRGPEHPVR